MLRQAGFKGGSVVHWLSPLKKSASWFKPGSRLDGWMVGWSLSVWSFYVLTESV